MGINQGERSMYQVTWSKERSIPSEGHKFMDTWQEVIEWIAELDDSEGLRYWTAAVVCDGSNDDHVEFYPESFQEKSMLMDNLVKMMPELKDGEVSASLMNFASVYWNPDDMVTGFKMLTHVAEGIAESHARKIDRRKLN
jgi:hypothetical protein